MVRMSSGDGSIRFTSPVGHISDDAGFATRHMSLYDSPFQSPIGIGLHFMIQAEMVSAT